MRPGRAIVQAFDAFGLEARHPLAHCLDRHAESGRDGLRRLSLDHHPPHQFGSTVRREPGILMNVHPGLRGDAEASQLQLPRSEPDGQPIESSQLGVRLGELFVPAEPGRQAGLYLEGLLSAAKRKNGWQLAELIGDARPWRTQRVLSHVLWDQDAARNLCRDYVIEHLGAADGVLIVDETGFLKKGEHSVGVARQDSGTAGRIENAQIGVFLAYASDKGHALIDRELYLPEAWCDAPDKRAEAAIPDEVAFATKPALAGRMIGRALDAGLPCAWVLGDEIYGSDRRLP